MFFTKEEKALIAEAISEGGDVWSNKKIAEIKRKIKTHYRNLYQNEVCCYCRRDFRDEHNIVIDIEHVLPKVKYWEFMFEMENLNISCKRCNMKIKNDRDDFVVDLTTIKSNFKITKQYKFIHPNFDVYLDNLDYLNITVNSSKLVKFTKKSDKGQYTYDYFQLNKIEVNTLSAAQGIVVKTDGEIIVTNLSNKDSNTLAELLKEL